MRQAIGRGCVYPIDADLWPTFLRRSNQSRCLQASNKARLLGMLLTKTSEACLDLSLPSCTNGDVAQVLEELHSGVVLAGLLRRQERVHLAPRLRLALSQRGKILLHPGRRIALEAPPLVVVHEPGGRDSGARREGGRLPHLALGARAMDGLEFVVLVLAHEVASARQGKGQSRPSQVLTFFLPGNDFLCS